MEMGLGDGATLEAESILLPAPSLKYNQISFLHHFFFFFFSFSPHFLFSPENTSSYIISSSSSSPFLPLFCFHQKTQAEISRFQFQFLSKHKQRFQGFFLYHLVDYRRHGVMVVHEAFSWILPIISRLCDFLLSFTAYKEHHTVRSVILFSILLIIVQLIELKVTIILMIFRKRTKPVHWKAFLMRKLNEISLFAVKKAPIAVLMILLNQENPLFTFYFWIWKLSFAAIFKASYPDLLLYFWTKYYEYSEPLDEGLSRLIILEARKAEFELEKVVVVETSPYFDLGNVHLSRLFWAKEIYLDSQICGFTDEEILAVVVHQLGHRVKNHALYGFIASEVIWAIQFFGYVIASDARSVLQKMMAAKHIDPAMELVLDFILITYVYSYFCELLKTSQLTITKLFENQANTYVKDQGKAENLLSFCSRMQQGRNSYQWHCHITDSSLQSSSLSYAEKLFDKMNDEEKVE